MNIIIVGQGAMGLLWYHHLNNLHGNSTQEKTSTQLSLLTSNKENRLEHTYSFTEFGKDKPSLKAVRFTKNNDLKNADIIIFCLKSYQIKEAIIAIENQIKIHTIIVLAHNGMGTLAELSKPFLERHTVLALLTTHACLRTNAYTVEHTGIGKTDLGLLSGTLSKKEQQKLTFLLNAALPSVEFHQDIKEKQWLKLAINAVINPITALNDIENGAVTHEKFNHTIDDILTEIITIAKAENITLAFSILKKMISTVTAATAKNSSSMRCDVLSHRKTEIDYINGYIHQLGLKHKIATPANDRMWQQINEITSAYS